MSDPKRSAKMKSEPTKSKLSLYRLTAYALAVTSFGLVFVHGYVGCQTSGLICDITSILFPAVILLSVLTVKTHKDGSRQWGQAADC